MSENETRRRPHVLSAGWGTVRVREIWRATIRTAVPRALVVPCWVAGGGGEHAAQGGEDGGNRARLRG